VVTNVSAPDPTLIPTLRDEFDALPGSTGAPPSSCQLEKQPRVLARFAYRSGQVVSVSTELGGCAAATNGAVSGRATGRYSHLLRDLDLLTGGAPRLAPGLVATHGSPGCSTTTGPQRPLTGIQTATIALPDAPFGIASTPDGKWSFVALAEGKVAVSSDAELAPGVVRVISVARGLAGASLTADGRYLLLAGGQGAYVMSAQRAERGLSHPVLGRLSVPGRVVLGPIEVTASPDGRYAFVSVEYSDEIAVFDLHAALVHHFRTSGFVGTIGLGQAVVGTAISPNGRWLYATSELSGTGSQGSLSIINLRRAETQPENAVVANVTAGCGPVRVAVSPDGRTVWVTARGSNALLGFSAARLLTRPASALSADVRVGPAPVGLAIVNRGREIVVADSNRFNAHANGSLTVINTAAGLAKQPATTGVLATGMFPRETSLEPDGTLLIGDFGSAQIQAINTTQLP
jgi:DNA-binding beta-propeller fold protein YncE